MDSRTTAILEELHSWIFTAANEEEAKRAACIEWVECELWRRFTERPFEDPRELIFDFSLEMYMQYLQCEPWMPAAANFKLCSEIAEDLLITTDHPTED